MGEEFSFLDRDESDSRSFRPPHMMACLTLLALRALGRRIFFGFFFFSLGV